MSDIPFTKAHGAKNDFLLTWRKDAPASDYPAFARAICDRHTGVGADGWMLVDRVPEPAIELYNSDGSRAELSGNGTRCAAAFLLRDGFHSDGISIRTGAGEKRLRVLKRPDLEFLFKEDAEFLFEMDMGRPEMIAEHFSLRLAAGLQDVAIVNVGNPQCAVLAGRLDFDWRAMGREIESHPHFPNRTNVSFIQVLDEHSIDVRFYERGAGETMSSGTGSTGAVAAAISWGKVKSPVRVLTPAGPLNLRWEGTIFLTGPAQIVADGFFHYEKLK